MTDKPTPADETALTGGIANVGQVVRVGDTVRRPRKPQNESVHLFLRHLRSQGLTEVPEPQGFDDHGREVLSWIDGFAPEHPHPAGVASDSLFVQVATLQRRMHEAAASFVAPADAPWNALGNYFPADTAGPLVCHNDLSVSNLILVRGDLASPGSGATEHSEHLQLVGVIDFDYSHPVDPLFDLAVCFRHWAPLIAPADLDPAWIDVSSAVDRLGLFADVHQLDADQQARMLELCQAFLIQARGNVRALADGGHVGFQKLIENGYEESNDRSVALTSDLRRRFK